MYINTFKYKPEDVSCVLCTEYVKKLGCTALSCPCLAERMEAGTVGYAEAVAELFPYRPRLTARIMRLAERFPGTMWQDDAHRKRMETLRLLLGFRKERDTPEFFAALYLLTSDKEISDRTFNCSSAAASTSATPAGAASRPTTIRCSWRQRAFTATRRRSRRVTLRSRRSSPMRRSGCSSTPCSSRVSVWTP